jgi:hypothetical protein
MDNSKINNNNSKNNNNNNSTNTNNTNNTNNNNSNNSQNNEPKTVPKGYALKFVFKDNQIQIQMQANSVSPHEMIGLLEMAKKQILDGMKNNSN